MGKKLAPIALAALITIPTVAFASEKEVKQQESPLSKVEHFFETKKFQGNPSLRIVGSLNINEREEKNILSVVNQYASESVEAWQKAIDERQELMKKLRDMGRKQRQEMINEKNKKIDELLDQLVDGKISKDQFKQQLKQMTDSEREQFKQWKDKVFSTLKALAENDRQWQQQLRQAVKSSDKEVITDMLSKSLTQLQNGNNQLKQFIETNKLFIIMKKGRVRQHDLF
jgi:hypothetical protein